MDNKKIPENNPLTDEQMSEIAGGEFLPSIGKCCAADFTHIYSETRNECPVCGCTEFTYVHY